MPGAIVKVQSPTVSNDPEAAARRIQDDQNASHDSKIVAEAYLALLAIQPTGKVSTGTVSPSA